MATITIINSTGTKWGTSGYTNGSDPFTLGRTAGYTCKGRFGFEPLNPSWYIKSIKLYMKRVDGYSSKVLKVGTNNSSSYDTRTTLDWSQNISVPSGESTKSWDLTAYKAIMQSYTTTWYFHFDHGSGDSSYCQFTAGTASNSPRLVIEYEEATLSVPNDAFTIGTANTITIGISGSGLTHTLSYTLGGASGTIASNVAGGYKVAWTPPAALANQITSAMSGTITLTLQSYLNGTLSSTLTYAYTIYVPSSYRPTVSSASFALVNPSGDTIGIYVQGRSKTTCTISASSVYGASIVSYNLTIGGYTYVSASNVITTNVLNSTGALSANIIVTDSRGQTMTYTASNVFTVYAYTKPVVVSLNLTRAFSDGTVSNSGTYIKYTLTYSFSALNNSNTRAGNICYKASGGSYGSATGLTLSSYATTITGVIGGGGIGSGSYVAKVTLSDRYNTTIIETDLANQAILVDFHNSGNGVAIGKSASTAGLFDVGINANFDKQVVMQKGFYVSSSGGTTGTAGWVRVCRITITAGYQNCPIELTISQRGLTMPAKIYILFGNSDTSEAPLQSFTYTGNLKSAYISYVSTGVWDVFVEKTEGYDFVGVIDYKIPSAYMYAVSITWTNDQVTSTPSTTRATYNYGDALPPILHGGINMPGVAESTKMTSVSTHYILYYNNPTFSNVALFSPWKASGQTYYNGVRVLQAGVYLVTGRFGFDGVTSATHGRLSFVAVDPSKESILQPTIAGSANSLPTSFSDQCIDFYNGTTDYETASSLISKCVYLFSLPANAIITAYCNCQQTNVTRGGGPLQVARIA